MPPNVWLDIIAITIYYTLCAVQCLQSVHWHGALVCTSTNRLTRAIYQRPAAAIEELTSVLKLTETTSVLDWHSDGTVGITKSISDPLKAIHWSWTPAIDQLAFIVWFCQIKYHRNQCVPLINLPHYLLVTQIFHSCIFCLLNSVQRNSLDRYCKYRSLCHFIVVRA